MSVRTVLWGKIGKGANDAAVAQFSKVPPLEAPQAVGLVPLEHAWGIPGTNVLIANDLPLHMLPLSTHLQHAVLHEILRVLPNNQELTRWDRDTATRELTSFMGGEAKIELWPDWQTDEGWARTFVQGPCAGDLRREGDLYVLDATALGKAEMRAGCAPLGVKIALHVDEKGPRPAWIERQGGERVTPSQGDRWGATRIIASAAMQNWVGVVRHVLNLHYIAGQGLGVLVHNFLPFDHPVHRLMWPHRAGTLPVNWTASRNFVGPHAIGVQNYAPSWKGWQQLVPLGWGLFRWEDYDIPEVFARRGTDELIRKGLYPFGEDATLIWGVIEGYVSDYLSQYYANDAAVAGDKVLQSALVSMDPVLPKPIRAQTRAELTRVLTRFISMVSQEHKLVSGIAWDYFSHPYFFPSVAADGKDVASSVPYREEAEANVMFRYALSARAWRMYEDWTYVMLDEAGKGAVRRFHTALRAAGKEIDARNARRKVPFPHLHPDGLETSIAV